MMTKSDKKNSFLNLGRIAFLIILVAGIVLSGRFAAFMSLYGLAFVVIGGAALLLTSFNVREIAAALRSAAGVRGESRLADPKHLVFWESASRDFWMTGVLATLLAFVFALSGTEVAIEGIANRMASSLIPAVYGVILSLICLVPWLKLREAGAIGLSEENREELEKNQGSVRVPLRFENWAGYAFFMALILWTLIKARLTYPTAVLQAWKWVAYWPSLLVIVGGTMALVLFVGSPARGRIWTLGFAVTGFLGSFMGIIQILLGLSSKRIEDIARAVNYILSSCFFSLLGMMLVGAPLEDRATKDLKRAERSPLSRAAWYAFPLVTLILLVLTFVLVLTPMKK